MCSQSEDTATNSCEATGAIAMCINCFPPPEEVLGNNPEPIPIGAGGTDISGALREPITKPARTHGYFTWSQTRGRMVHHPWLEAQNAQVKQRGQNPIWGHKLKPRSKQEVPWEVTKGYPPRKSLAEGGPT